MPGLIFNLSIINFCNRTFIVLILSLLAHPNKNVKDAPFTMLLTKAGVWVRLPRDREHLDCVQEGPAWVQHGSGIVSDVVSQPEIGRFFSL